MFLTKINRRYLISLGIILFLLLTLFALSYFIKHPQDIRKKAAEINQQKLQQTSVKPQNKYKPGEVLIKLKNPQKNISDNLNKANVPLILMIDKKYQIKTMEKVFKNAQSPDLELTKFKRKFSQEISRGTRKINEQELLRTDLSKIYKITFDKNIPVEKVVEELKKNPEIEYAEPNYIVQTQLDDPNDPYYSSTGSWGQSYPDLWGIKKINSQTAWETTVGSETIIVADIDTGVDRNHEDLQDNMWVNTAEIPNNRIDDDGNGYLDDYYGWDFANNDNDPMDDNGHGTHTVGTIAAVGNNEIGVVGVSWKTKIMSVKFLNASGSGFCDDAAKALVYAANAGVKISSNSWGGDFSQTVDEAVTYAHALGITIVVAAGNIDWDALSFSPASSDRAITVGATDSDDQRAIYARGASNWGEKIDVTAPGKDILSLRSSINNVCGPDRTVGDNYCRLSGTSMATPHVAGLAALLLSQNPSLTNEEIRQLIRISSTDLGTAGKDRDFGYGRIDAGSTLSLASFKPLTPLISSPHSRELIKGISLDILGNAAGESFRNYKLEIGEGRSPIVWNAVSSSDKPVLNGVLGRVDLSKFTDRSYTIRLTITDNNGKIYNFQVFDITVDNFEAEITSPNSLINKEGSSEIRGTASVKGTFSLQNYAIEWKPDSDISSWTTTGVTLINQGRKSVNNGLLAIWDTKVLQSDKRYFLRLTVKSTNGFSQEFITKVYYAPEKNLRAGWPKTLENPTLIYGNRIVSASDIDNDGKKEIIAHNGGKQIYVFNDTGNLLPGWPFDINPVERSEVVLSVLVADVDDDNNREIIIKTSLGRIFIVNKNGSVLPGWPKEALISADFLTFSTPVAEDLDNDGKFEVIINQGDNLIHAYSFDASEKPGWPVSLESISPEPEYYISTNDVNGDGFKEVIINSMTKLYVLKRNGTNLAGWPQDRQTERGIPVSGDLDRDGKAEIITLNFGKITIYGDDGKIKTETTFDPTLYLYWRNPALGDLNNDGFLEIVLVDLYGRIYALDYKGNLLPGFPIDAGFSLEFTSSASLADIDSDGQKEILVVGRNHYPSEFNGWSFLYAYTFEGKLKEGYPKMVQIDGTPTVSDLDNNSELELLFISGNEIHVWNLEKKYSSNSLDWPQDLHDARFTASLPNLIKKPSCYKLCDETAGCQSGLICTDLSCKPEKSCSGKTICINPACRYDKTCQCLSPLPSKTVE